MSRTSSSDVQAILPGSPSTSDIDPHVTDANSYINEQLATGDISSSTLTRIEKYVAAHRYKFLQDRTVESFQRESTTGTFSGEFGEGLRATPWGQMAIEEDPTGVLAQTSKPKATIDTLDSRGID